MPERLSNEAQTILKGVKKEHCGFSEVNWFIHEMAHRFQPERLTGDKPELIIVGEDFPAEVALAVCDHPRFLLGGSLEITHWSDAVLPRDADPVSRSVCGWLLNKHFHMGSDALVVVTLSNDNRRKLAGLLKAHDLEVLPVDMLPVYTAAGQSTWVEEMLRAAREIATRLHTRFTARHLTRAIQEIRQLRQVIQVFQRTTLKTPGCMSPALREIIVESVWYAEERSEWLRHLQQLTGQIVTWQRLYYVPEDNRPWVITAGSPIIFPNEKLPLLLEASGLFLAGKIDALSVQADMPAPSVHHFDSVGDILKRMAAERMLREVSGAWTMNRGLTDTVRDTLKRQPIDGIVYHVLKGQIEYDFELPRVEAIATEYNVPVFRLETDYQQQDVEQLRIRMEAFSEMLQQRNIERMRLAQ